MFKPFEISIYSQVKGSRGLKFASPSVAHLNEEVPAAVLEILDIQHGFIVRVQGNLRAKTRNKRLAIKKRRFKQSLKSSERDFTPGHVRVFQHFHPTRVLRKSAKKRVLK